MNLMNGMSPRATAVANGIIQKTLAPHRVGTILMASMMAGQCPVLRQMGTLVEEKPRKAKSPKGHQEVDDQALQDFVNKCPFAQVVLEAQRPKTAPSSSSSKKTASSSSPSLLFSTNEKPSSASAAPFGLPLEAQCPVRRPDARVDYEERFEKIVQDIRKEGRYRHFADIERQVGSFPVARRHDTKAASSSTRFQEKDLECQADLVEKPDAKVVENAQKEKQPISTTIWCSNDYLAMGHHPQVIEAMVKTVRETGAGSGGTRNISGNSIHHRRLESVCSFSFSLIFHLQLLDLSSLHLFLFNMSDLTISPNDKMGMGMSRSWQSCTARKGRCYSGVASWRTRRRWRHWARCCQTQWCSQMPRTIPL